MCDPAELKLFVNVIRFGSVTGVLFSRDFRACSNDSLVKESIRAAVEWNPGCLTSIEVCSETSRL